MSVLVKLRHSFLRIVTFFRRTHSLLLPAMRLLCTGNLIADRHNANCWQHITGDSWHGDNPKKGWWSTGFLRQTLCIRPDLHVFFPDIVVFYPWLVLSVPNMDVPVGGMHRLEKTYASAMDTAIPQSLQRSSYLCQRSILLSSTCNALYQLQTSESKQAPPKKI